MRFIININNTTALKYKRMNHEEWKRQWRLKRHLWLTNFFLQPCALIHTNSVKSPILTCLMANSFQRASCQFKFSIARILVSSLQRCPLTGFTTEPPPPGLETLTPLNNPFISNSPTPFLAPNCLHYKALFLAAFTFPLFKNVYFALFPAHTRLNFSNLIFPHPNYLQNTQTKWDCWPFTTASPFLCSTHLECHTPSCPETYLNSTYSPGPQQAFDRETERLRTDMTGDGNRYSLNQEIQRKRDNWVFQPVSLPKSKMSSLVEKSWKLPHNSPTGLPWVSDAEWKLH